MKSPIFWVVDKEKERERERKKERGRERGGAGRVD